MRKVLRSLPVIKTEIEESVQAVASEATEVEQKVESASGGMPVWAIILIVSVVVLLLVAVAVFFVILNKKKKGQAEKKPAKAKTDKAKPKAKEDLKKQPSVSGTQKPAGGATFSNVSVPDRNGAIYPEIVLINLTKTDCVYRTRIIDKVLIGRKEGCDIRISTDAAVSSRQCIISVKGTQFYLEDCNSSNGTYYNDREVTEQIPIMSGGVLEIGHDKYRLMIGK